MTQTAAGLHRVAPAVADADLEPAQAAKFDSVQSHDMSAPDEEHFLFVRLENAFDSHVHWLGTGQMSHTLRLHSLATSREIATVRIQPHYFLGDWLLGFGWDDNRWPKGDRPTRQILDDVFGETPVCFTRADAHAIWVNTAALKRAGLWDTRILDPEGGRCIRDEGGQLTGVLVDRAIDFVRPYLPEPSPSEVGEFLRAGMRYFNARGFTHIRDLSCSQSQWEQVVRLDGAGEMSLAVEQFFDAENPDEAEQVLARLAQARKEPLRYVRVKGLKVFYDGALGSEGALVSCPYCSGSGVGLQLMSRERLRDIMIQTWEMGFELAVHAIGDEANHQVASVAATLWREGRSGLLNIEHAQMMRPETIELLRHQSVHCHMQPCHWLSDRRWLAQKIAPITHFAFPWRALERAAIPLSFGSDSPIEEASLFTTRQAIEEGCPLLPSLHHSPWAYHSHPDREWIPSCYTNVDSTQVQSVIFEGRSVL